jgi:Peptidase family M23
MLRLAAVCAAALMLAAPAGAHTDSGAGLSLVWPASGTVTRGFGWDGPLWHPGIDIGELRSLEITAAAPGLVEAVGEAPHFEGYGNIVLIDLGGGIEALYAHLSEVGVQVGDIGVGNNGNEIVRDNIRAIADAGKLELIERDGEVVAPGITARAVPGHAPGQHAAIISSGGSRVVIVADAIHRPGQVVDPAITLIDVDPAQAAATRRLLLADLETADDLWTGSHFPGLAFGRIVREGGAVSWLPVV